MILTPEGKQFLHTTKVIRLSIKELARTLKELANTNYYEADAQDVGELGANLALAYRHLEDASMRVGKAIQAFDGGQSVYDESATGPTKPQARNVPTQPEPPEAESVPPTQQTKRE